MAISVTISGSTYTYTISNIQNAFTCTPSNRSSRYGVAFGKPTIKRNKSGEAFRRYFYFRFIVPGEGEGVYAYHDAEYRAIFTKNGTTATVDEVNAGYIEHSMGSYAEYMADSNKSSFSGTLKIYASTGEIEDSWKSVTTSYSAKAGSGWTPSIPQDIVYTLTQNSAGDPDPAVFGYIAGFAKASWMLPEANAGYWEYGGGGYAGGTIYPYGTTSLSANGATVSRFDNSSIYNLSLSSKLVTSETITATANIKNTFGGTAARSKPVSFQPYTKPLINTLSAEHVTTRAAKQAKISIGYAIDQLNKQSTVTQDITTGTVTAVWSAVDLSDPNTEYASGSYNIIENGDSITDLVDTADITLTDSNRTRAHDTYDDNATYRITVTLTDRLGQSSEPIPVILKSKFYLISAKAGGKGLGIGIQPTDDGFHVDMPATFYDDVDAEISELSGAYSGGLNDEALLTTATINKWKTILGIS